MDVDNNEFDLISQFRSMQTNDKDCLIEEFKRLSNTHLSNEGCMFYLDLANWNLNTALWHYYEYDSQDFKIIPSMKFICDVTMQREEVVQPNIQFIKKWRVKNCGNLRWPPGCNLRLISGAMLSKKEINLVEVLNPDEEMDICVEMLSPTQPAIYQCQYRLFTPTGTPFGDPLWLFLNVEDDSGLMAITQQLNNVNMFENNNNNNNNCINNNNNNNQVNNCESCYNYNDTSKQQLPQVNNQQIIEATSMSFYNQLRIQENNFNNQNQTNSNEDDKRPDFYDEMFS